MKQCISLKNTNSHNVRNAISDPRTFTKVHVIHIPNLTLFAKLRGLYLIASAVSYSKCFSRIYYYFILADIIPAISVYSHVCFTFDRSVGSTFSSQVLTPDIYMELTALPHGQIYLGGGVKPPPPESL
jgi:hypothetical protein